jgi:hypothetical protein
MALPGVSQPRGRRCNSDIAMRRRLLASIVLPVLAFLAAGCGSGGSLALDPVASAATKTQQAGTYRFDFTANMSVLGMQLSFGGSGASDEVNRQLEMSMDFKDLLPPALTKGGSVAKIVLADTVMYMQMPFVAGELPNGKSWLKLDLGSMPTASGVNVGSFGQVDPQQWLQQLLASNDTKKIGTDSVQGEQMTHYATTVDPAKLENVPAGRRAAVRKAMQQIGMKTIPVDVWVDGQGFLRREALSLTLGKALQSSKISMTFDLHDFGTAVDVTTPPADQVYDATALVKQAARGSGSAALQSEWAARANAVCRSVSRQYAKVGTHTPKSYAARVRFARAIIPIEADELAQLDAIHTSKSADASKAIALLRVDLAEGRTAVASAGDKAAFTRLYRQWYNDHRATDAFGAAGATDCS